EAMQPHVETLVRQAMGTLVQLAREASGHSEVARRRLARLVLQALRRRLLMPSMVRVPVFRVLDGSSSTEGGERTVDLMTLREEVLRSGPDRMLPALYPDQRPERYALGMG